MDLDRFDDLSRTLTSLPSRRGVLGGLASALFASLPLALGGEDATAKKKQKKKGKNKKKKKKHEEQPELQPEPQPQPPLVFNQFGCLDVGQPCRGDSTLCCSGICEGIAPKTGNPDTSRCVAHNVGGCQAGQDDCVGEAVRCGQNNFGVCHRTTGNASFCVGGGACSVCNRDTDCERIYGPGAACIACMSGCPQEGTSCAPPAPGT